MKKIYILFLGTSAAFFCQAQLVNNGGTITVQPGAMLVCNGSLTNTSGTITNNGRIEVQGNFTNAGTYNTTTNDDSLILSGAGNVVLNPGGASISYLSISKTANTDAVLLGSSAIINNKLDYLVGSLSTDYANNPSFMLSAPASAVFNIAAGREIIGRVRRTSWAHGSNLVFNAAHMQVGTSGGTAPTDITVTMLPQSAGGDPTQAEREVKRKFLFAQNGGSGFTADLRFPYNSAELNTNTEANLVPWFLNASEWNAKLTPVTRDAANDWVATTGVTAASFGQEWKLADPKYSFNVTAFLRGAWNGSSMNTTLNSLLPLSQPYNTTPFNYAGGETVGAIPANVVDWVLVELRKPASGAPADANSASIIGRKAGFLKNDGTVVDLDGVTPIQFDISKQGASFITVRHRNHLGVMSNSIPSNALGTFANNFSVLSNSYKNPAVSSQPLVLLSGGSNYGLWAGDANKSGNLAASDVTGIKNAIANGMSGYQLADVNMSGNLAASDVTLTKAMISQGGQGSSPTRMASSSTINKNRSHIPDPVIE